VKIGPVDTEIALLIVKKNKKGKKKKLTQAKYIAQSATKPSGLNKEEEITEGKIYSPFGKFAKQAK